MPLKINWRSPSKDILCLCDVFLMMTACPLTTPSQAESSLEVNPGSQTTGLAVKTVMYGVSYYPEYEPEGHLQEDIALMKRAGITTVRMDKSTWSLWEPEDGKFEFAGWIGSSLRWAKRIFRSFWELRPTPSLPGSAKSIRRFSFVHWEALQCFTEYSRTSIRTSRHSDATRKK